MWFLHSFGTFYTRVYCTFKFSISGKLWQGVSMLPAAADEPAATTTTTTIPAVLTAPATDIIEVVTNDEITINFMQIKGQNKFCWPKQVDRLAVPRCDILCVLGSLFQSKRFRTLSKLDKFGCCIWQMVRGLRCNIQCLTDISLYL